MTNSALLLARRACTTLAGVVRPRSDVAQMREPRRGDTYADGFTSARAPLGLVGDSADNLRCLTAPARVVTALRACCINRFTRHLWPEHKRDKHSPPQD
jgi:hypothetical protein